MVARSFACLLILCCQVFATPLIWDGRARLNFTSSDLDRSVDPYLTYMIHNHDLHSLTEFLSSVVKGSANASHVRP